MATKRHKPEEIVRNLRQVEVLVGQGMARVDAIREVRIRRIPGVREVSGLHWHVAVTKEGERRLIEFERFRLQRGHRNLQK